MIKTELDRIAKEYCDGLYRKLIDNTQHFNEDWDGFEVRGLAMMIQEPIHPGVKKAIRRIKKSGQYFAMSI